MASLDTTELKLKSTPTGGMDASHSPYYRRLLSAGYKGFLQGSIGGAMLYGALGVAIGGLVAPIVAAVPAVGVLAWLLVPAAGAVGFLKGASTFGNIGSVAAINAESADLSEQRRYLLDRYYDLPEGPEGDREAEAIKQELLARQKDTQVSPPFFHWKTVAIGAAVGIAIALAGTALFSGAMAAEIITDIGVEAFLGKTLGKIVLDLSIPQIAGIGSLALGVTGATIGIDRYYIRKWFDHTEGVVHSSSHKETAVMERQQMVERLREAAQADEQTKQQLQMNRGDAGAEMAALEAQLAVAKAKASSEAEAAIAKAKTSSGTPIAEPKAPVASLDTSMDKPSTTISGARRFGLLEIQRAMDVPTV